MKALSWLLALSTLMVLIAEAVTFHRAIVCRQEAWLKATVLKTRTYLSEQKSEEKIWHHSCRLMVWRKEENISWHRLPSLKKNTFAFALRGSL